MAATIVCHPNQVEAYFLAYFFQKKSIPYQILHLTSAKSPPPIKDILLKSKWVPKGYDSKIFSLQYQVCHKPDLITFLQSKLKTPIKSTQIPSSKNPIIILSPIKTFSKISGGSSYSSSICIFKRDQPRIYKKVSFARNLEIIPPIGSFYSLREAKSRKTPIKSAQKKDTKFQIGIRGGSSKTDIDQILQGLKFRKGNESLSSNLEKYQFTFDPSFQTSPQYFLLGSGVFPHLHYFTGLEINFFLSDAYQLASYFAEKKISPVIWNLYLQKRKEKYEKNLIQPLSQNQKKSNSSHINLLKKFPQLVYNESEFNYAS